MVRHSDGRTPRLPYAHLYISHQFTTNNTGILTVWETKGASSSTLEPACGNASDKYEPKMINQCLG